MPRTTGHRTRTPLDDIDHPDTQGRHDTVPRTVTWLAEHPDAREVVCSVWNMLTELERAGHHPGALDALRFVLIHHQPPTRTGRPPAPAVASPAAATAGADCGAAAGSPAWSGQQIRGELLGHLTPAAPRFRRVPSDDLSPGPGRSLLLTGGMT